MFMSEYYRRIPEVFNNQQKPNSVETIGRFQNRQISIRGKKKTKDWCRLEATVNKLIGLYTYCLWYRNHKVTQMAIDSCFKQQQ